MTPAFLLVVPAYAVGTFPAAMLIARRQGHDPSLEGSGNPGASNVYRVAGRRAGLAVGAIDIAKGALPTLAGLAISGRPVAAACWCAAVAGHVFPVTRRLRGGKGVATAGGGALALYPLLGLGLLAVFLLIARVIGKASVGSLTIALALVAGVVARGSPAWEVGVTAGVVAVVLLRHRTNIARLLSGRERGLRGS